MPYCVGGLYPSRLSKELLEIGIQSRQFQRVPASELEETLRVMFWWVLKEEFLLRIPIIFYLKLVLNNRFRMLAVHEREQCKKCVVLCFGIRVSYQRHSMATYV